MDSTSQEACVYLADDLVLTKEGTEQATCQREQMLDRLLTEDAVGMLGPYEHGKREGPEKRLLAINLWVLTPYFHTVTGGKQDNRITTGLLTQLDGYRTKLFFSK
jgi:hypothetical protein